MQCGVIPMGFRFDKFTKRTGLGTCMLFSLGIILILTFAFFWFGMGLGVFCQHCHFVSSFIHRVRITTTCQSLGLLINLATTHNATLYFPWRRKALFLEKKRGINGRYTKGKSAVRVCKVPCLSFSL